MNATEQVDVTLMKALVNGIDDVPRIKKVCAEMLRILRDKTKQFEDFLWQICDSDKAKIDKIKSALEFKKTLPQRRDLRAFMKARNQKTNEEFEILVAKKEQKD